MLIFAFICTAAACLAPVTTTTTAGRVAAYLGRRRRAQWAAIANRGPALPAVYAVVPMAAVGKASQPASQRKAANG